MTSVYSIHLKPIHCLYDDSAGISHVFEMHLNVAFFSLISFNSFLLLSLFQFEFGECRKRSKVSNQFRKIEFSVIPPKEAYDITVSRDDNKKSLGALHLDKYRKKENK